LEEQPTSVFKRNLIKLGITNKGQKIEDILSPHFLRLLQKTKTKIMEKNEQIKLRNERAEVKKKKEITSKFIALRAAIIGDDTHIVLNNSKSIPTLSTRKKIRFCPIRASIVEKRVRRCYSASISLKRLTSAN